MNKIEKALTKGKLILKGRFDLAFKRKKMRMQNIVDAKKLTGSEKSQNGQDAWIINYFKDSDDKNTFVEFGAHDGITNSNTYILEKEYGWDGLLIEPLPDAYLHLAKVRSCKCLNACITSAPSQVRFMELTGEGSQLSGIVNSFPRRHKQRIKEVIKDTNCDVHYHDIRGITLDQALEEATIAHVDYLSIDTEGSELEILTVFPFSKYAVRVFSVENNYHGDAILELMDANGYELARILGADEIYIRRK